MQIQISGKMDLKNTSTVSQHTAAEVGEEFATAVVDGCFAERLERDVAALEAAAERSWQEVCAKEEEMALGRLRRTAGDREEGASTRITHGCQARTELRRQPQSPQRQREEWERRMAQEEQRAAQAAFAASEQAWLAVCGGAVAARDARLCAVRAPEEAERRRMARAEEEQRDLPRLFRALGKATLAVEQAKAAARRAVRAAKEAVVLLGGDSRV